jgi:hypothetical protein
LVPSSVAGTVVVDSPYTVPLAERLATTPSLVEGTYAPPVNV